MIRNIKINYPIYIIYALKNSIRHIPFSGHCLLIKLVSNYFTVFESAVYRQGFEHLQGPGVLSTEKILLQNIIQGKTINITWDFYTPRIGDFYTDFDNSTYYKDLGVDSMGDDT